MSCELQQSSALDARTAGDISKATGSAKVALAGNAISSAGGVIAAAGSAGIITAPVAAVVGGIVALVGGLVTLAGKLFGNKWHQSSGVRWLLQKYQYFVLGDTSATSSNHVNEALLQDAYNWWTAVLGVPIYDKYRYHALAGEWPDSGKMIEPRQTYSQRAAAYMAFPEAANVSFDNAVLAAKLADQFDESLPAGGWQNFEIAPVFFSGLTCDDSKDGTTYLEEENEVLSSPGGLSLPSLGSLFSGVGKGLLFPVVMVIAGLYLLFSRK